MTLTIAAALICAPTSRPVIGISLWAAEQIGLGLVLFGSFACMIVGAIFGISAWRSNVAIAWISCFVLGWLGMAGTVIMLFVLYAEPGHRLSHHVSTMQSGNTICSYPS